MTTYDDTVHGPVPTPTEVWRKLADTFDMMLRVKRLDPRATIPAYQTEGAGCFDLHALEGATIPAGRAVTFRTGLAFGIPPGWRLDVYSRSGLGFKHGLRLVNCTGKVDQDYTGEVLVRLHNDSTTAYTVTAGDRIAQAEVNRCYRALIVETDTLHDTQRGSNGLGSTGA